MADATAATAAASAVEDAIDPEPGAALPRSVHGRVMLVSVGPVLRKPQHFAVELGSRDEKPPVSHGFHVDVTLHPGTPIAHDWRFVGQGAD